MKWLPFVILLASCTPPPVQLQLPDEPTSIMQPCTPWATLKKGATLRDVLMAAAASKHSLRDCTADQHAESQWIHNLYQRK